MSVQLDLDQNMIYCQQMKGKAIFHYHQLSSQQMTFNLRLTAYWKLQIETFLSSMMLVLKVLTMLQITLCILARNLASRSENINI